jgi:hypothetical protein
MTRGGPGIDDLVDAVRTQMERGGSPQPMDSSVVGDWTIDRPLAIRDLLWENRNCQTGVPLASGRKGLGAALLVAKRLFRRLSQPFINDLFERQRRFNDAVVALADEVGQRARELEQLSDGLAEERAAALARRTPDTATLRRRHAAYADQFARCRRVIHLGCGRGDLLSVLADRGISAYGVDRDDRVVAHCRAQGWEAVHADVVEHLVGLDGEVDGIFVGGAAEHLGHADFVQLLRACHDRLAPGGLLIVECAETTSAPSTSSRPGAASGERLPRHPELVRLLLERAGLSDVRPVPTPAPHVGAIPPPLTGDVATWESDVTEWNARLFAPPVEAIAARKEAKAS